jgi:hypothetical protein
MQAVCDARIRFLWVEIQHPASTSDYLELLLLDFLLKLENGLLAPGQAIFGDSANVNTDFLVSPNKGVSRGPKDDFIFYQSQKHIAIECTFGMLVHRWGLLRRDRPCKISLAKIGQIVICLCKLNNFCINEKDGIISDPIPTDDAHVKSGGGFTGVLTLPSSKNSCASISNYNPLTQGLIVGGNHNNDTEQPLRRSKAKPGHDPSSPREIMLQYITEAELKGPA